MVGETSVFWRRVHRFSSCLCAWFRLLTPRCWDGRCSLVCHWHTPWLSHLAHATAHGQNTFSSSCGVQCLLLCCFSCDQRQRTWPAEVDRCNIPTPRPGSERNRMVAPASVTKLLKRGMIRLGVRSMKILRLAFCCCDPVVWVAYGLQRTAAVVSAFLGLRQDKTQRFRPCGEL